MVALDLAADEAGFPLDAHERAYRYARERDWASHPIDRLYRAGVSLNANTDSRMLTPATLSGELEGLRREFGWGAQEFLETNLMAVEAAFVAEPVKARLRRVLASAYAAAPSPPSSPAG